MNFFDPSRDVYPHAITNEALIEHSFGFIVKQGQYQLQDMYQYVHAKNKHEMDFQMHSTDLPFNQYTKIKLRDKGYQQMNDFKSRLYMKDFWEIFVKDKEQKKEVNETTAQPTEQEKKILRQAYLLTKSVPRRSNRSKWKEESGFQPNLLMDNLESGKLLVSDLVFCKSVNEVLYLKIKQEIQLLDKEATVPVQILNSQSSLLLEHVKVDSLLSDKGFIITITQTYDIVEGTVTFNDVVAPLVADVIEMLEQEHCGYSDEDLAILPESSLAASDNSMLNDGTDADFNVLLDEVTLQSTTIEISTTEECSPSKLARIGGVPAIEPNNHVFYIVVLAEKKHVEHYIAQAITAKNSNGIFWFDFMRTTETVGEFLWCEIGNGLVSKNEIVKCLSNPIEKNKLIISQRQTDI